MYTEFDNNILICGFLNISTYATLLDTSKNLWEVGGRLYHYSHFLDKTIETSGYSDMAKVP